MKKVKFLIMLILGLCPGLKAQSVYEDIYTLVRGNNPDLVVMRADMRSQLSELRLDRNLEDPEIEFGRVWGTNTPENKWDLSVSQTFDFPTLYSERKKAYESTSHLLELNMKVIEIEKLQEAKMLLIGLTYCKKALDIQKSIMENLDSIQSMMSRGYKEGEMTILEVNKAKIEYVNVCRIVADLQAQENDLLISLNALCGGALNVDITDCLYPADQLYDINYYYECASSDPVITAYDAKIRNSIIGGKVDRLRSMPRITIGYQHEREGSESYDGFKVALTLPVFSLKGKVRKSREELLSLNAELDAAKISMIAAVDVEYSNVISLKWLLDRMAPVFNTTNHPDLLRKAFLGGELSAMSYLTELNYFRQAETEFLNAERDYHLALARLNRYTTKN